MKMRGSLFGAVGILCLIVAPRPGHSQGEPVKFGSSMNPVGSGGRAVAWGGAFIAVADDATAASWNPAGLVQLEKPECSVVLSYLHRGNSDAFFDQEKDLAAEFHPVDNFNPEAASHGDINYASMVFPFHIGPVNLVPSVNYQRLYEMDVRIKYDRTYPDLYYAKEIKEKGNIEQVGALTTVTPALGVQITPKISLGVSANWWGLDPLGDGYQNQFQQEKTETVIRERGIANQGTLGDTTVFLTEQREEFRFSGWNWQAGFLVKPGNFTLGGVYKAGFDADIDHNRDPIPYVSYDPRSKEVKPPDIYYSHRRLEEKLKRTWPASYGLGVAYRFSDAFSMAVDVNRTEWSKILDEVVEGPDQGLKYNPLAPNGGDLEDTTQYRAGMEYLIIKPKAVVALRGGAFYDPEPREDEQAVFYGVSLGTGFGIGHVVADFAYSSRFGWNIPLDSSGFAPIRSDVVERFVIASLIYHF